jgi:PKD repeat protein
VTITINPANDGPVVGNDSATTTQGVPVTINVLANDSDPDGEILRVVSVTPGMNGSTSNNGNGNVTYTPNAGFAGMDTFGYQVCDPFDTCAGGSVSVEVVGGPSQPQTITLQVNRSSDDVNEDGSSFNARDGRVWVGTGSNRQRSYLGLRFNAVNIPPGATITSVRLEVYSPSSQWITVNILTAGEATGNSATFTSATRPSRRPITVNRVTQHTNNRWNANTWYAVGGELAPIVQEIVNRGDWLSGNSLSLILKGRGASWGRKFVTSFNGNPARAPRLIITFTAPATASESVELPIAPLAVTSAPVATFTPSVMDGAAPLAVQFSNTSQGEITGYAWDFGDGGLSTEISPMYTFATPGVYTVRLTANGPGGAGSAQTSITVNAPPTPEPTAVPAVPPTASFSTSAVSGDAPLAVVFTNQSSGEITGYAWDFGNGGVSTESSPTYTYVNPGSYTVTLIASGPGGTSSAQASITVNAPPAPPIASLSASATNGDAPLTLTFINQSTGDITGYTWNFGDGGLSTEISPIYTFANPGVYMVSLTITGPGGQSSAQVTITVTQSVSPPVEVPTETPPSETEMPPADSTPPEGET